ncbi:MAG: class D beta-lactamase [Magnetococcales bacterium]|nr:class D beta-lactamase [Magnetococcales bacterium]
MAGFFGLSLSMLMGRGREVRVSLLGAVAAILFTASVGWAEPTLDSRLATVLHQAGVEGCIVVVQPRQERTLVSNLSDCQERLIPASTFKMANALIALETGVVEEEEVFPWDGASYSFSVWEQDMTLRQAMAVSAVPVFQQIARRIGLKRMAEWVTRLGYGNRDIGDVVDRFWLDGPLAISPLEQATFMALLANGQLPVAKSSMTALRRIIPRERMEEGWSLFGKTGWAVAESLHIGWYVGWVERQDEIVPFAVKIPMPSLDWAPLRISLAKAALHSLGVVPPKQ